MIAHAKPHAPLDVYATTVASRLDRLQRPHERCGLRAGVQPVGRRADGPDRPRPAARKRTGQSLFTLQMMLHYFREAREGEALAVTCRLIEHDDKRMRVWLELFDAGGERLAASEQLLLSVALAEGGARAAPWTHETQAALDALQKLHASMPHPPEAGAGVAMTRA